MSNPNVTYNYTSHQSQHLITNVSFRLTGTTILICGSVYVVFGLWSVRRLMYTGTKPTTFDPRWLMIPLSLGVLGAVYTLVSTLPIALAIGLVYASSNTIVEEDDLWSFVLPLSILVIFYSFGTVKLTYTM